MYGEEAFPLDDGGQPLFEVEVRFGPSKRKVVNETYEEFTKRMQQKSEYEQAQRLLEYHIGKINFYFL